ncbi:hypothetical protein H1C71_040508 [Ictidomys tridecemlineatus]|nr:hypothetical protein H1C71_040508 [Ictidomys tridecemlineatus]
MTLAGEQSRTRGGHMGGASGGGAGEGRGTRWAHVTEHADRARDPHDHVDHSAQVKRRPLGRWAKSGSKFPVSFIFISLHYSLLTSKLLQYSGNHMIPTIHMNYECSIFMIFLNGSFSAPINVIIRHQF